MMSSYGSEGEFISREGKLGNGNNKLNGNFISVLIAVMQVLVVLSGVGMFIRSIEKSFDLRMTALEMKINSHMSTTQRNTASVNFHHTIGVQCSKGCHITRDSQFEMIPSR